MLVHYRQVSFYHFYTSLLKLPYSMLANCLHSGVLRTSFVTVQLSQGRISQNLDRSEDTTDFVVCV